MKTVREKRREITRQIHEGTIKEIGSVSAKSKIIRNLNMSECDNILRYKEIQYSKYKHIIAQEGVEIFSEGIDSDSDGGKNDSTESDGDSEKSSMENDDGNTDEPSPEIPDGAMQKLAEENDIFFEGSNNTDTQYMTNQGLFSIDSVMVDMGIDNIKNVVGGQAKVMDKLIQNNIALKKELDKVKNDSGSGSIEIKVSTIKKPKKIEGVHFHPKFQEIVDKLQLNSSKAVYLCGGAGTGKTTLAKQISEVMELPFGFLSCTEGMSEAHLLGRMKYNGNYIWSQFIQMYENGGVFLLDEMDAMDSNVAVSINSALANGEVSVPNREDKPVAKRHENFFVIGAGNTWGSGQGSNMYSGRNKLDTATLDRFTLIEVDYDRKLEKMLSVDANFFDALNLLRDRVKKYGLNRVIGTRRYVDAGVYHTNGKSLKYFLDTVTTGWTKEEINKVGIKDIVANMEGK